MQNQAQGISKFHQNQNFHFEAGFGFSAPFCTICAGYRPIIPSICHVTDIARKSWFPTHHGLYQQPMDVLENAGTCAKSYSAICDPSWKATISSRIAQRHHSLRVLDTTTLSPRLRSLFSVFFIFFQFFSEFSCLISGFQALFLIFELCWFTGIMPGFQCPRLHCTIRPSI